MIHYFHYWVCYPKKIKTLLQKDIFTTLFIAALFTIAKIWKHLKYPSSFDEWRRKSGLHTHNGILCSHEKSETMVFASFFKFFKMFLFLRERERDRASEGRAERQREGDTESEGSSRFQAVSTSPTWGLNS